MKSGGELLKEEIEFLKWQFNYIIDQIKFADNKANFLLAIYLSIMGIFITQVTKIVDLFLNVNMCLIQKSVAGFVSGLFFYYIVKSFYNFVNIIKPRIKSNEILGEKDYRSLIFWGDVSEIKFENFKNSSIEKRYDDLIKQVFIISRIANEKFRNVNKLYETLPFVLTFFIALIILLKLLEGG